MKQSTTKDEKARGLFTPGNPIEPLVGIRTRMVVHDAEFGISLGARPDLRRTGLSFLLLDLHALIQCQHACVA